MNLDFSIADLDNFALSEDRFQTLYDVGRSYAGIPIGDHWSVDEFAAWVEDSRLIKYADKYGSTMFSVRGEQFDLSLIRHSIVIRKLRIEYQRVMNVVKTHEEAITQVVYACCCSGLAGIKEKLAKNDAYLEIQRRTSKARTQQRKCYKLFRSELNLVQP